VKFPQRRGLMADALSRSTTFFERYARIVFRLRAALSRVMVFTDPA
jgi:hypothetical protein